MIKACEEQNIEKVTELVESGEKITPDAIVAAINTTNMSFIQELTKLSIEHNNDFLLFEAAHDGNLAEVDRLIELGADVHYADDEPLKHAAANGHLEVVKRLIELGADVHAQDDYALRRATENGHSDVVDYFNQNTY